MSAHDALVLAAGGSLRLGQSKQLLRSGGETLIRRAVRLVLATLPRRTLVVLGAQSDVLVREIAGFDVETTCNADWREGIASSLRRAHEVLGVCDAPVLVVGVDQLRLTADHLYALLELARCEGEAATAYAGVFGLPAVIAADTFARSGELRGDLGFRALWRANGRVPGLVDAPELAFDLDTPQALREAVAAGLVDA